METATLQQDPSTATLLRPLRVLHVLDHGWPVHTGYSIRSLHLIAAQKCLGLRPEVLTGPLQLVDDPEPKDTDVEGTPYWRTPVSHGLREKAIKRRWPVLREVAVVHLIRRAILRRLDAQAFDIIHAHSPALCGLGALQAARARRVAFVYELRAFWEDAAVDQNKTHTKSLRYAMSRRLENYVIQRADAVVGIAHSILEDLTTRKADPAKLFYVPNGVDSRKFVPRVRDDELAAQIGAGAEPVLGFIGSLYRWEGVAWLVHSVAELRRRGCPCKLLVVGDGEDMPAVRNAVRELKADSFVHLTGRVPHGDVERYYSVIDLLVYPRHRMRLTELVTPLKPLEAMALAKPILGSDVGGIRELVEPEKTGLLFRADDIGDFCRQAQRLINDEPLRRSLGAFARQQVLRERDWSVIVQRYGEVYDTALRNRG